MNLTLSETMRDLLEVFETADDAGEPVMFDSYLVALWREALTEGLEAAQTIEATVAILAADNDAHGAYERAVAQQQTIRKTKAEHDLIKSLTVTDEFDSNVIVLPTATYAGVMAL